MTTSEKSFHGISDNLGDDDVYRADLVGSTIAHIDSQKNKDRYFIEKAALRRLQSYHGRRTQGLGVGI